MWTLTEKRMLFHVVGSAMENHHLKRSVLCIFFFCFVCHFLQSNQQGQQKPGKEFFPWIGYFKLPILLKSLQLVGARFKFMGDSQCSHGLPRPPPDVSAVTISHRNLIFCSKTYLNKSNVRAYARHWRCGCVFSGNSF